MSNHRADHRTRQHAALARPSAPGRRRAEKVSRSQGLPTRLSALPTFVGLTALVAAGAGALTVSTDQPASAVRLSAESRILPSGTDAVGYVGGPRARAISSDSERMALQDAADAKLQQVAEQQAAERNAALKSLGRAAEARAGEIAKNQWTLPTTGYHLTARFGMSGGLWSSNHTGLDFAGATGTPIVAVANGTITEPGSAGAYGNRTIETLEDGTEIWYCHQNVIEANVGDKVISGQRIGQLGSTGNTTGPHLHLEVRPGGGDPVDPFQALVFHGVTP